MSKLRTIVEREEVSASYTDAPSGSLRRVCTGIYDILVDDIRTGDTLIRVRREWLFSGTFGTGDRPGLGFCSRDEAILILSSEYAYDVVADRTLATLDAAAEDIVPDAGDEEAAAFDAECDRLLAKDEEIGSVRIIATLDTLESEVAALPRSVRQFKPVAQRDGGIYIHLSDDALMWQGQPRRRAPLYLRA